MNTKEPPVPSAPSVLEPPGGVLIWAVVLIELFTFGVALIIFVSSGRDEPDVFHAGRQQLQPFFGITNTVFLLVSGYFMAQAIERYRHGQNARPLIRGAMIGGCLFLILKGIEYSGKIHAGLTLGHDTFITWYWLLTVFHVLHVIVGLILLAVIYRRLHPAASQLEPEDIEAGAVFWHMCDLIWLILFPVIYLLP